MHIMNPVVGCHYFPPGTQLPTQPSGFTAFRPVPTYTAWWQRHIGVRNLPKVFTPCAQRRIEPTTSWSQVQRYTTVPRCQLLPRCYTIKIYVIYASATKVHFVLLLPWLWPLTLKTFSAIPTHMVNICVKFHWNPSTKQRYIASCEIGAKGQKDGQTMDGRTDGRKDGRPENVMPLPSIVDGRGIKFTIKGF